VSQIGDYSLLEEIGRGGMGVVYKAVHAVSGQILAVKLLANGHFAGAAMRERFQNEARILTFLRHPGIVAVHEFGEQEGLPFLAMEYIEGTLLAQWVPPSACFCAFAARLVRKIAGALQFIHERGVLHLDLKPANVLVDCQGEPRVIDFGLARQIGERPCQEWEPHACWSGVGAGSPSFMPPEQATGMPVSLGPASDIYSVGALLYHLLTGRPPFVAESLSAALRLLAAGTPEPPRRRAPEIPQELERICLKCLEKNPDRRFATAQELADELSHFV
jgi:serine/threonine-protein kinase